MPVYIPPGAITNTGAFNKNLVITTTQVNGYTVYTPSKKTENLGGFVFNAIVEDAIMELGGNAIGATKTGLRLARLAGLLAKTTARGVKTAKTAVQGTKLAKNTANTIKTARTAVKKALPKTPEATRKEIYKAQGYKEYVETKADKEIFSKLHEFENNNPEFKKY